MTAKGPTKKFRDLRQRAAEFELRALKAKGMDVVVVQRRSEGSPSPLHTTPAIFLVADLRRYERELADAKKAGVKTEPPPPPPVLDFAAWSFYPTCPRCRGRRVQVDGVGLVNGRTFDVVETVLEVAESARASCLRPVLGSSAPSSSSDCGWAGTVAELCYPCFRCGKRSPGARSGVCSSCSSAPAKEG